MNELTTAEWLSLFEEDHTAMFVRLFEELCDATGDTLARDYSGRGMFGRLCLGIICDNPHDVLLGLAQNIHRHFPDDDIFDAVTEDLRHSATDQMGRNQIIYWPDMRV